MCNSKYSKRIRDEDNYPFFDAVQDMGWLSGLHVHIDSLHSIFVQPYSQVLFPRAAFNPSVCAGTWNYLDPGAWPYNWPYCTSQSHKDNSSRLSRFPWMTSHASYLATAPLSLVLSVDVQRVHSIPSCIAIDENTKQYWALSGPLRNAIFYCFPFGCWASDYNSGCDHPTTSLSSSSLSFKSMTPVARKLCGIMSKALLKSKHITGQ